MNAFAPRASEKLHDVLQSTTNTIFFTFAISYPSLLLSIKLEIFKAAEPNQWIKDANSFVSSQQFEKLDNHFFQCFSEAENGQTNSQLTLGLNTKFLSKI